MTGLRAGDFAREVASDVGGNRLVALTGCLRDCLTVTQPLMAALGVLGPRTGLCREGIADWGSTLDCWCGRYQRDARNITAIDIGAGDSMAEAINDQTGDTYRHMLVIVGSLQSVA